MREVRAGEVTGRSMAMALYLLTSSTDRTHQRRIATYVFKVSSCVHLLKAML